MIWLLVCLVAVLAPAVPTHAQSYETLEMVRPVAIGTAGSGLSTNNRIYRAYKNIEYRIHADARGGKWPYTYSLSGAPAGMSIVAGPCTGAELWTCTAGEIAWTPSVNETVGPITVTVRDSLGTEVTGVWSITVSESAPGTSGFCFVNAATGSDANSGTLASPWQTQDYARLNCGQYSIMYLRGGTYPIVGNTTGDCTGGKQELNETRTDAYRGPVIWLGYPGETVTLDFQSDGGAGVPCVNMTGQNIWIENVRLDNVGSIGFRIGRLDNFGAVFRYITGVELLDGEGGQNSAFIMWASNPSVPSRHDTVQLSSFDNIHGDGAGSDDGCALKFYTTEESIIETSTFANTGSANAFTEATVALKAGIKDWTVRTIRCAADVLACVGGNMDTVSYGEVYHTLCLGSETTSITGCLTLHRGANSPMGIVNVYRNTFLGQVLLEETDVSVLQNAGPYYFNDNVILNASVEGGACPDRVNCVDNTTGASSPDYTRLVMDADNVLGANDGTKANQTTGLLVGASRTTYFGVAGYELGDSVSRRFSPTLNLRRAGLPLRTEELN